jgi:predicted small integral membrane protein
VTIVPAGNPVVMDLAAGIVLAVFVVAIAALVIGLFVWAAVQDGRKDREVQARLGIRRRTRLGR